MRVRTVSNEKALRELQKYMIRPEIKRKIYIISALLLILAFAGAAGKLYLVTAACLAGIAAFLIELNVISRKQLQVNLRRIREMYNADSVEGILILEPGGLRVMNSATGGEVNFSYDVMSRFVKTENYYALFTKEYQMIIIDRSQFDPSDEERFMQLAAEKMPGIING